MSNTTIVKQQQKPVSDFRTLLEKSRPSIEAVIPKHLTADRLIKIAMVAYSRTPGLAECTPMSLLQCVMTASQLGFDVGGITGHAYMVPFNNKHTGRKEAQFQLGYRGMIDLARRSGMISSIEARVVCAGDRFECEFGASPRLVHVPNWDGDRGEFRLVYAVARLKDGGEQLEVMTKAEIDAIKRRAKSQSGPWVTDYNEMAKKTVIRRIYKMLPMSIEMMDAYQAEAESDQDTPAIEAETRRAAFDSLLADPPSLPDPAAPTLAADPDTAAVTESEPGSQAQSQEGAGGVREEGEPIPPPQADEPVLPAEPIVVGSMKAFDVSTCTAVELVDHMVKHHNYTEAAATKAVKLGSVRPWETLTPATRKQTYQRLTEKQK